MATSLYEMRLQGIVVVVFYQNKYPVQDDEWKKLIGLLCRDVISCEKFVVRLRFRIKAEFGLFFFETVDNCFKLLYRLRFVELVVQSSIVCDPCSSNQFYSFLVDIVPRLTVGIIHNSTYLYECC